MGDVPAANACAHQRRAEVPTEGGRRIAWQCVECLRVFPVRPCMWCGVEMELGVRNWKRRYCSPSHGARFREQPFRRLCISLAEVGKRALRQLPPVTLLRRVS